MKALITGSTGFVGREITKEMLKRNISLRVTSRDKEKTWFDSIRFNKF